MQTNILPRNASAYVMHVIAQLMVRHLCPPTHTLVLYNTWSWLFVNHCPIMEAYCVTLGFGLGVSVERKIDQYGHPFNAECKKATACPDRRSTTGPVGLLGCIT